MSFGPQGLQGGPARRHGGQIDYRLRREAVVRQFRLGHLGRDDVCDAHPELMRAARNLGQPTSIECPICSESRVVLVAYAFGPRLPASGRCVGSVAEMGELAGRTQQSSCYVVEVCPNCCWNHLYRMELVGGS